MASTLDRFKQFHAKQQSYLNIPLDLLLAITETLDLSSVIALSETCHKFHLYQFDLLKVFAKKRYSKLPKNLTEETLKKYIIWKKIKEAELDHGALNATAYEHCMISEKEPLPSNNWETLLSLACLGDLKPCQYLLEHPFNWRMGYFAILGVLQQTFLAQKKHSVFKFNNEQLVYDLLFNSTQGYALLKKLKHIRLVHHTRQPSAWYIREKNKLSLNHFYRNTGFSVVFLDNPRKKYFENLDAKQGLLIGAIAAGYFRVAETLINQWKVKPSTLAMIHLARQITRASPQSHAQALFLKHKPQTKRKQKALLHGFIHLDSRENGKAMPRHAQLHEAGHYALIPELASQLNQPIIPIENNAEYLRELLAVNIKAGRIERVQAILQNPHLYPDWITAIETDEWGQIEDAWKVLCKRDPDQAAKMLAYWLSLYTEEQNTDNRQGLLVTHVETIRLLNVQGMFVRTLLKLEYLNVVLQAWQINQDKYPERFSDSKEEFVLSFVEKLPLKVILAMIEQAIQGGHLQLLELLEGLYTFKEKYSNWIISRARAIANDEASKELYEYYIYSELLAAFQKKHLRNHIENLLKLSFEELEAMIAVFGPGDYSIKSNALDQWLEDYMVTLDDSASNLMDGAIYLAKEAHRPPKKQCSQLSAKLYQKFLLILLGSTLDALRDVGALSLTTISNVERLDVLNWYLSYEKQSYQNVSEDKLQAITQETWEYILEEAIDTDSLVIFEAASHALQRAPEKADLDVLIDSESVRIIGSVIRKRGSHDYQALMVDLLHRLTKGRLSLGKRRYTRWCLLFKTLFKHHKGRIDPNCLDILGDFLAKQEPEFYCDHYAGWLELLLFLANEMSDHEMNHHVMKYHKVNPIELQDNILYLLREAVSYTEVKLVYVVKRLACELKYNKPRCVFTDTLRGSYFPGFVPKLLEDYLISLDHSKTWCSEHEEGVVDAMVYLLLKFPTEKESVQEFVLRIAIEMKRSDLLQQLIEHHAIAPEILNSHQEFIMRYYNDGFFGENTNRLLENIFEMNQIYRFT